MARPGTRTITLGLLLAFLLAIVSTATCTAQSGTAASAPPLPKDPAALLALVAQHNGLNGPSLKPWHIRATYQLYDAKGNPTEKGVFEEWWNSPKEYKLSFSRPSYHMQLVVNAKGTFISGDDVIPYPEYLVKRLYLHTIFMEPPSKTSRFHGKLEKFGSARLYCVEEISKGLHSTRQMVAHAGFPSYCMEPSSLMLRIYSNYGVELTEITGIGSLEGRYLAEDAVVYMNRQEYLTIHLDKGESTAQWNPDIFAALPGVSSNPHPFATRVIQDTKVIAGNKVTGKDPIYPIVAKENHQSGTVLLFVLIGKDGRIHNIDVVTAPSSSLANSAVRAVKTWKYKPYLLDGHPVRVQTIIRVVYILRG